MDVSEIPALPADVAEVWDADPAAAADRLLASDVAGLAQVLPGMVVGFRNGDVRALASDPAVGNVAPDLLARMMSFIGYDDPARGFVPVISSQVFAFTPPLHAPARRALTRRMTPGAVDRFDALADRVLAEVLDGLDTRGGSFDLVGDLAGRVAARFFATLAGLTPGEADEAQALTEDLGGVFLTAPTPAQVEQVSAAAEAYVGLVSAAVDRVLASTTPTAGVDPRAREFLDGLVRDLAAIDVPGVPGVPAVGAFVAGNLFDGFHTAGVGIATALWALVERPAMAARVRAAPGLAAAAYDEATRLAPPLLLTNHHVLRDTTLATGGPQGEVALPAGTLVVLHWGAANRDPGAFDAPADFDLDRPTDRLLTFGRGPHACPGRSLSRFLGRKAIDAVLARPWTLEPDRPGPTWAEGATVSQLRACPVRPVPRPG